MTDYIEREAAIKKITALSIFEKPEDINRAVEQERRKENEWLGGIRDALVEIGTMDAADVRPVVRGRWIVHDYGAGDINYECSECKDISCCRADFCPDCGADMREEDE